MKRGINNVWGEHAMSMSLVENVSQLNTLQFLERFTMD